MAGLVAGYSLVSHLGYGARSTILHVVDLQTGRPYALKRVFRRTEHDDRFLEQAKNEFAVSSRTDHPYLRKSFYIRRLRKWLQTRELQILMELVEGRTLEQQPPGDLSTTIEVFVKVAAGLASLHELGYVHADIKPNNILVGENGSIKIIDFGQSCPIGHIKQRIQGTPDYIAPEQVRRLPIDRRTDVFNLGATLYWVLTGQAVPTILPASTRRGGIGLAGPREVLPPHELKPETPLALSRLVMDCCQGSPKDRPTDMNQVISRLEVVQHLIERHDNRGGSPSPERSSGDKTPSPGEPSKPSRHGTKTLRSRANSTG